MIKIVLFCFSVLFLVSRLEGQCSSSEIRFEFEANPGNFPAEGSWRLLDKNNNIIDSAHFTSRAVVRRSYCLQKSLGCVRFVVYDSFGDGINAGGYYHFYLDGVLHEVISGAVFTELVYTLNCDAGRNCLAAIPILGTGNYTASFDNTWFRFTPSISGVYQLSSCGFSPPFQTTISVYDACSGLRDYPDGPPNTLAYSGNACSSSAGADIQINLDATKIYYIKVGDGSANASNGQPINFTLSFIGQISGCTDRQACNYNPLATIDNGTCVYRGSPNCQLSDLTVDSLAMVNSLHIDSLTVPQGNCYITEGCLNGYNTRYLISFATKIANVGNADFILGSPPSSVTLSHPNFTYDLCHAHWHYTDYARYKLFKPNGDEIPVGKKTGFCVQDVSCPRGIRSKYNCANMGITASCYDLYDTDVACQWMDITDLPLGAYTFVSEVNYLRKADATGRQEASYNNNRAYTCIETYRDATTGKLSLRLPATCQPPLDCNGAPFGNARRDCRGTCEGATKMGDLDNNLLYTKFDYQQYFNSLITNGITPNLCNDLDANGRLNLADAALLQECVKYQSVASYWGNRTACGFPSGRQNLAQRVLLRLKSYNHQAGTVDLELNTQNASMKGVQFQVTGLPNIYYVENLLPNFDKTELYFAPEGRVIMLDTSTQTPARNATWQPFIRLYFRPLVGSWPAEICLNPDSLMAINELYETINAFGNGACLKPNSVTNLNYSAPLYRLEPNPNNGHFLLKATEESLPLQTLQIYNITGQLIYTHPQELLERNNYRINLGHLPAGIYQCKLQTETGLQTIKLMIYN